MSVLHQSTCIFKTGLSSLNDGWVKYKEKVPEVSDTNQNVETTCTSKLKFKELNPAGTRHFQDILRLP